MPDIAHPHRKVRTADVVSTRFAYSLPTAAVTVVLPSTLSELVGFPVPGRDDDRIRTDTGPLQRIGYTETVEMSELGEHVCRIDQHVLRQIRLYTRNKASAAKLAESVMPPTPVDNVMRRLRATVVPDDNRGFCLANQVIYRSSLAGIAVTDIRDNHSSLGHKSLLTSAKPGEAQNARTPPG